MDQILYLEGDEFVSPFSQVKSGEEVTISVKAVLANASSVKSFEAVDGKPQAHQKRFANFVIKSISRGGRMIAQNEPEDIERQIAEAKAGGDLGTFDYDEHEDELNRFKGFDVPKRNRK